MTTEPIADPRLAADIALPLTFRTTAITLETLETLLLSPLICVSPFYWAAFGVHKVFSLR